MLEQEVVGLADRAVDDVLDRDDAGRRAAAGDRLEDLRGSPAARPARRRRTTARTASSANAPGSPENATGVSASPRCRAEPVALERPGPRRLSARTRRSCRAPRPPRRARPAAARWPPPRTSPAAGCRPLGRARPVLLGEQLVERLDVGLDRGRDDVPCSTCPVYWPRRPVALGRRGGAIRTVTRPSASGPSARRGCRRRSAGDGRSARRRAPCRRPGTARRPGRCPRPTPSSGGRRRR